jgi:hypothetical protein
MKHNDAYMNTSRERDEFVKQAQAPSGGLVREYIEFLKHGKKWYLGPIVLFLLLAGLILVLGSSAAAPIIYTLF